MLKKLQEIYPKYSDHNRGDDNGWIDYPVVESGFATWEWGIWDEYFDVPDNVTYIKTNKRKDPNGKKFGNVIEILDFAYSHKGSFKHGIVIYDKEMNEYRKMNLLRIIKKHISISLMKADNILNGILDEEEI